MVNCITLSRNNVTNITLEDISLACSKEYWHKFLIENGALYDKEEILKAILESIDPVDIVPVKYSIVNKDAYFLARNCVQAIEAFYKNLMAPIKIPNNNEVFIEIHTCFIPIEEFKVNMQIYLKQAIEKRYSKSKKGYIDLTKFHKEPELYDVLFCPLYRPKFLLYVLSILKRILVVTSINLSSNDLENLKPLEVLQDFKGLLSLNLSENNVCNLEFIELIGKAVPSLEEINLRGNPICNNFDTELEYLKWIKNCFPSIKELDTVSLNYGIPNHQFWISNKKCSFVINEFIRDYFIFYDSKRKLLKDLYTKDSIFSLSCAYNHEYQFFMGGQHYNSEITFGPGSNYQVRSVLKQKNTSIIEFLCNLPHTKHVINSFKVDVLDIPELFIMLIVSGVFKSIQTKCSKASKLTSFTRTFLVKKLSEDEFKITNDLFYVTNATTEEIKIYNTKENIGKKGFKKYARSRNKNYLIKMISNLTTMNYRYSKRCLQNNNWDAKKALEVFLENYQDKKIPSEAFQNKSSNLG